MVFGRWFGGWTGTKGTPRSANGASSLHLTWEPGRSASDRDPWVAVEADLEVVNPPQVDALHFWALQASFGSHGGRSGAAHLGLQRYSLHPGGTAVNWGGYGHDGRELDGTASDLPSAPGNPNTRDFAWQPSTPYRLCIERGDAVADGLTAWRGLVTDLRAGTTTLVRELHAPGDQLSEVVVWSEVFARCDDPGSAVRWSRFRAIAASGSETVIGIVRVNYQSLGDGGCATTDARTDVAGILQVTGTPRGTALGSRLAVPTGGS